jgi:hypothetical protein
MPKGNPNPSPSTRFTSESPARGRQKGARDRMSTAFLNALADDSEAHGKDVVATVRKEDPSTYLRVFASLAPKEIEISRPLDGMDDSELLQAIETLTEIMRANTPSAEPEEAPKLN